jgi:hypothetical protein
LGAWARYACSGVGLLLLVAVASLYSTDRPSYMALMNAWMDRPYQHPFMDWEWFPAAAACWANGINVYLQNPCYLPIPEGAHNYPPIWLRLSFLAAGQDYIGTTGLIMAVGFFAVLSRLPAPPKLGELVLILLVSVSSLVAFALERANVDVLIFIATVLAVCLLEHSKWHRLFAYAVFILMGLLKFYPWVLLALAVRERPRVLAVTWIASAIILAGYLAYFHDESVLLVERGLPKAAYIVDMIGAVNLPGGIATVYAAGDANSHGPTIGSMSQDLFATVMAGLVLLTVLVAAWFNTGGQLVVALQKMRARDLNLLVAGACMMVLCFFAGQSVGYRAIFLLLCVPGVMALKRQLPLGNRQGLLRAACVSIVVVMWVSLIQWMVESAEGKLIGQESATVLHATHWLIRELGWWLIISALSSILIAYFRLSIAAVLRQKDSSYWLYERFP